MDAVTNVPPPVNEPVRQYAPGSQDRAVLESRVKEMAGERAELTMTAGGRQRMGGGDRVEIVQPHNYRHVLGELGNVTETDVTAAIDAASQAAPGWRALSYDDRAAIFLKAAELLAGPWRATINASTILGQSKSVYQAEIDAACELIDFWRYNVHYGRRLLAEQPESSSAAWNRLEYRPLEGFVLAVTPFNFTSIAGNLPTAPALMGNVVVWKPSHTQQLSAHYLMRLLEAAGLPPGVINMVTGDGRTVSRVALAHEDLAGIHFTGSTGTFQQLWRTVGQNIASYRGYPRLIGDKALATHADALARAKTRPSIQVLAGGEIHDAEGYFVQPTVLACTDPTDEVFTTEYFGPILGVHVFDDADYDRVVAQAADASPYALTGSIIARDRMAIAAATQALRFTAGNFYINDKPTGAVVGQQPFGGARASGTNDKAGSIFNLIRWVNARTIKELFVPPVDYRYPHMG